ncbi:uncharacterized protein LOC131890384 isoform X2 [Tigriopus californicus]|uniref:uncharacterized protein LOC131890384 isoform X2 n=1 Tax=Tigriopus californicus TaxID=6832 RepID=UPI0027DA550E|nr:uncharacterized protein LOC131890384 isoform X2 [Tigriopus californicus]
MIHFPVWSYCYLTWVLWAQVPLGGWCELEQEKPRYFQRTQSTSSVQWPQVFHQVKGESNQWTKIDRACRHFGPSMSSLKSNWTEAFAFCHAHGGEMVNWNTLDTNQLVRADNEFKTLNWEDMAQTGRHEEVISSYWLESGPKGARPSKQPFVVNHDGTQEYTPMSSPSTMVITPRPCANHSDADVTLERQCLKLNMMLIKHNPSSSSLPSSILMLMDWNNRNEKRLPSPSFVFCWELTSCSNKAALPLCVKRGATCPPHHLAQQGKGSSSRFKRFINHPFRLLRRMPAGSQDYAKQNIDQNEQVRDLDLIPESDEDHHEEESLAPKINKQWSSNRVGESSQPAQKCCPSPWTFTDGGCYHVDKKSCPEGCSWTDAKAECVHIGGSIAVLSSKPSRIGALKAVEDLDGEKDQLFWVELPEEGSKDTRRHWCSGFPQSVNKNLCIQLRFNGNGAGCWEHELCQKQRLPICYRDFDTTNCSKGLPFLGSKIGPSENQMTVLQPTSELPTPSKSRIKTQSSSTNIITSSTSHDIESSTIPYPTKIEVNKSLKGDNASENVDQGPTLNTGANKSPPKSHNFVDVLRNIKIIERMEVIVEQQSKILKDIKEEYKKEQVENRLPEDEANAPFSVNITGQEDSPANGDSILKKANSIRIFHEQPETPKETDCRRDLAELSQCFICTLQLGTLGDPCHCSKIIGTLIDKFLRVPHGRRQI